MKALNISKYLAVAAVVAAVLPFSGQANTITFFGTDTTLPNQNPSTVLSHANFFGVDSDGDLTVNDRFTSTGSFTDIFGSFTITLVNTASGPQYELTFSLNPGFVLAGVGIHGGSSTDENFFSINDATSGTNEGLFFATTNSSGVHRGLSNFDLLLESVPDGGTTAALLGFALAGLAVMRRWVKC